MTLYPIKPTDINTKKNFKDAFSDGVVDIAANFLVRFAITKGGWYDFTENEINVWCDQEFPLNELLDDETETPLIQANDDGTYSYTHKFIAKCFLVSPVNDKVCE